MPIPPDDQAEPLAPTALDAAQAELDERLDAWYSPDRPAWRTAMTGTHTA